MEKYSLFTFKNIAPAIREEINIGFSIWKELLQEFGADYAYTKGSAVKSMEAAIDYVPELSDIDIHVKFNEFPGSNESEKLKRSLCISKAFRQRYFNSVDNPIHIPRAQVTFIDQLEKLPGYITPILSDVKLLFGEPNLALIHSIQGKKWREIDKRNLLQEGEFLPNFYRSAIDLNTLAYWKLLRRLSWRVSPSIARFLSQSENPKEIWECNRSGLLKKLQMKGCKNLADSYTKYYLKGWDAFNFQFQDDKTMSELILSRVYLNS